MYATSSLFNLFFKSHKEQFSKQQWGGGKRLNFMALLERKKGFLGLVFTTLLVQLAVTFFVMYKTKDSELAKNIHRYFLIFFILNIGMILMLFFVPMPMPLKFTLFTLFSALNGVLLTTVVRHYGVETVKIALVGSIAVFVTMLIVGFCLVALRIDIGFMGLILFAGLLGIVIAQIVMLFVNETSTTRRVIATVVLALFSMYVVYDTNMLLLRDYKGDFVTAALDYYVDFLNIFTSMSQLSGE